MTTSSMEELGAVIAANVKSLVAGVEKRLTSAVNALAKRIDDLPAARDGLAGRDGRDASLEDVRAAADQAVAALNLRGGEPGRDGKDGQDATPPSVDEVAAAVMPALEKRCDELVAKLPPAEKGEPGRDGKDGEPGAKGDPGRDIKVEDVVAYIRPEVQEFVKSAVDAIPRPADGRDVDPEVVIEAIRPLLDDTVKATIAALPPAAAGQDGAPGKPADPDAVAKLLLPAVKAHLDAAVSALPPPAAGRDGADGKSVDAAEVLAMVKAAAAEIPKPVDGRDGRDGPPGRDAIQIDVLPAIDETRSYPRATYAGHKGGLWRSHKTTEGLAGWECIVAGIDRVEVRQSADDPREFVVETTLSTGAVVAKTIVIPAVIDCGVYREGTAHRKGDGVTWARHYWIARRDTSEKPDVGDDWRLAVKSGRDGKDGKDGDRGPQGLRGEPGRNPGDLR